MSLFQDFIYALLNTGWIITGISQTVYTILAITPFSSSDLSAIVSMLFFPASSFWLTRAESVRFFAYIPSRLLPDTIRSKPDESIQGDLLYHVKPNLHLQFRNKLLLPSLRNTNLRRLKKPLTSSNRSSALCWNRCSRESWIRIWVIPVGHTPRKRLRIAATAILKRP